MADADDIRVKRVTYLIDALAKKTGEDPFALSSATDGAATVIENKYDRQVTRQKLLEQMKTFFYDPEIKVKISYADAITAQIMIEYAK